MKSENHGTVRVELDVKLIPFTQDANAWIWYEDTGFPVFTSVYYSRKLKVPTCHPLLDLGTSNDVL